MGFFSWHTSDTKRSIPNHFSNRAVFPVYMITEDCQVYLEKNYGGYGHFGGKDIYVLIAELNGITGSTHEKRIAAIDLTHQTYIVSADGTRRYKQGLTKDADFFNWEKDKLKAEGNKSANQLVEEKLFTIEYPNGYGDWNIAATKGIKLPKLVENLPGKKHWVKTWNTLPYPESCQYQGYFYPEMEIED